MPTCDLHHYFAPLAANVPTDLRSKGFLFLPDSFPILPTHLTTHRLYIQRIHHSYNDYRVDALWIRAHKPTYRYLGLCILAAIFQSSMKRVELRITHPWSDIASIFIDRYMPSSPHTSPLGLVLQPYVFHYQPDEASSHPWALEWHDVHDFPRFCLTNTRQMVISDEEYHQRDTLVGFGNVHGAGRLAQLLLDFSRPESTLTACALESEGGFRGVGIHSAEATFFLPGHVGWDARAWSDEHGACDSDQPAPSHTPNTERS